LTDPDVVVVGAGILGCALSAFLAEAGASVLLVERDDVGAAASGRNSGILQHPMDAALAPLFEESLELYRGLEEHGFSLASEPPGVLLLAASDAALAASWRAGARVPGACRRAGRAARGRARGRARARRSAARDGLSGRPVGRDARVRGARGRRGRAAGDRRRRRARTGRRQHRRHASSGGRRRRGGRAVDARAGRSARRLATDHAAVGRGRGGSAPHPARHALEEAGVEQLVARGGEPPPLFSLVTTGSASALGSAFLPRRPDPDAVASLLHERWPALRAGAHRRGDGAVRACARPLSADGLPLLGRAPGRDDVFVAAGHGPWGISLGPASARLVAELVLEGGPGPPPAFDPARFR
jgi:glycine/D-amino acid oxidase-like deaminating enzyme